MKSMRLGSVVNEIAADANGLSENNVQYLFETGYL